MLRGHSTHLLLTLAMIYLDGNSHAYGTEPGCLPFAWTSSTGCRYLHSHSQLMFTSRQPDLRIAPLPKQLTSPRANNHVIFSPAFISQLRFFSSDPSVCLLVLGEYASAKVENLESYFEIDAWRLQDTVPTSVRGGAMDGGRSPCSLSLMLNR